MNKIEGAIFDTASDLALALERVIYDNSRSKENFYPGRVVESRHKLVLALFHFGYAIRTGKLNNTIEKPDQ